MKMTNSNGSKDDGSDRRTYSLQRRLPTEGLQTIISFRGKSSGYYHGAAKLLTSLTSYRQANRLNPEREQSKNEPSVAAALAQR
jgi:hypothetical protein